MNQIVLDEQELRDLYLNQKLRMKDIADLKGVSVGTVFNQIKKYQIPARSKAENYTLYGKPMSEKHKQIISQLNKGKSLSEEQREKLSSAMKKGGIGFKKTRTDGYIGVYFPDHPKSNSEGYIMEHDLVMECIIGRHLHPGEVVHHINKNRSDNRKENLQLMTASEHMRMHMLERYAKGRAV